MDTARDVSNLYVAWSVHSIHDGRQDLLNQCQQRSATTRCSARQSIDNHVRQLSNEARAVQDGDGNTQTKSKTRRNKDHQRQKDFFLSVLSATTTRRDAKSYLSSFKPTLYGPMQQESESYGSDINLEPLSDWPLHVALIKLRSPQTVPEDVLQGLASTLSLLSRLGLAPIIVLDCAGSGDVADFKSQNVMRELAISQTHRIITAFQRQPSLHASRLDSVLGVTQITEEHRPSVSVRGAVEVQYGEMLRGPLRKGTIPVIPPIGYTTESQRIVDLKANDVILALTRDFAGFNAMGKQVRSKDDKLKTDNVTLDRIIILDPLGGLPSAERPDKSHIFVNMEQEYWEIKQELLGAPQNESFPAEEEQLRMYAEQDEAYPRHTDMPDRSSQQQHNHNEAAQAQIRSHHVANLDLLQRALAILPPSSSALLTTPTEAATITEGVEDPITPALGVRTRSPRNPLIYNLLTNKPLVSSSLPVARVDSTTADHNTPPHPITPATFCKRGMPLTMIPDPRVERWAPPNLIDASLAINLQQDPRVDFSRLINLVEDSFGRTLDVHHYLSRIKDRLAGLIVAGSYEGGAILTWELPPSVPASDLKSSDPLVAEAARRRMVPYLDKFAVLKRSQGSGGVADILFTAMVRSCFPNGVCWRSRRENPVNKWYFERSVGSFKVPGGKWTMFWTTEGLPELDGGRRFQDYLEVCNSVGASWSDGGIGME